MPAGLAIRHLRARVPAQAQPVAARLALQLLGAGLEDALPTGLPPQALLWLRRLRLQAPGAVWLRPARGGWRDDWVAAGRRQMDDALARAARPALGPVPDAAEAVLFADAAEMLACLALAMQAGQLDRWWWRGLLGRAWPHGPAAWAARPEAQAGALRLLHRAGQGALAQRWGGAAQGQPAAGMSGVAPAAAAIDAVSLERLGDHAQPAAAGTGRAGIRRLLPQVAAEPPAVMPERCEAARTSRSQPPPSAVAPAEPARAPAVSPGMPQLARAGAPVPARDLGAVPTRHAAVRPAPPPVPAAAPSRMHDDPVARLAPARRRADAPPDDIDEVLPPPRKAPSSSAAVSAVATRPLAPAADARRTTTPSPGAPASRPTGPGVGTGIGIGPSTPAVEVPAVVAGPGAWPWPQAVPSRQAPLLFVVNALLEDGLYPDFTRPRDAGLPVPLWALLAALAAAWRLPADPLQAALLQHGGAWRVPPALPAAPGVAAGPWDRWLRAYARALRRRLCRRLRLRPADWPRALTLARPARLWLSEAEWVAELALDTHDVAWRLAGLDRDPGWLPAAGCSLRFVFTA